MNKLIIALLIFATGVSYSQITAFTEKGDTVYLWDDGTWGYTYEDSEEDSTSEFAIDTNYTPYTKSSDANKVLKGQKVNYQLWYDDSEWTLTNNTSHSAEYFISNKANEAFCMIIPERFTTTTSGLLNIALTNAGNAGTVNVISYEMRKVNNNYLAILKMTVFIDDVNYYYMGYYYTGKEKTIQVITYTYENLFDEYEPVMEKLLNGLIVE